MGFVLMIPFLLVRFGLLSILGRGAVLREIGKSVV